jgi:hypothetical protein
MNMLNQVISRKPSTESKVVNNGRCNEGEYEELTECNTSAAVKGLLEDFEYDHEEDNHCKREDSKRHLYKSDETETWRDVLIKS